MLAKLFQGRGERRHEHLTYLNDLDELTSSSSFKVPQLIYI